MGTNELRGLPRTATWRRFIEAIDATPFEASALNQALAAAAARRLGQLGDDPALADAFGLLVRLATAARQPGFADALAELGLPVGPNPSAFGLIVQIAARLQTSTAAYDESGHFADISALSLSAALTETVGTRGPGLFESSVGDLQDAFRAYATEARFGELAERYFGDFMARTFTALVDREIANHIGGGRPITTVAESHDVKQALGAHARATARVVREFAGEWFSKHNWQSGGAISAGEIRAFLGHAVHKLRTAFAQAAVGP